MLFRHQLKISEFYKFSTSIVKKLVSDFFNKEKYVFHYEKLQFCLGLELKPNKIRGVLEFNQPQWLKSYIEFNT